MNIRYRVTLSLEERGQLLALVNGGKASVRRVKRAQILLAAAAGSSDERIAAHVSVGISTVYRTKRRFVEEGLEPALSEAQRPGAERKLAANEEALLVATVCSKPPAGRARWTLSLLADEMVRLTEHRSLSCETVRRRLAENELKPWQKKMWYIPKVDAEFVAKMEDALDLYAEAPDERCPVVCFDETPRQLIGESRVPIAAKPGKPARVDYEYAPSQGPSDGPCATARRTSSCLSTRTVRGDTRRSPTGERRATSPRACATSWTSTIRGQIASGSSWTTSPLTRWLRSMSISLRPRLVDFFAGSNFTTPPSTPAG
jgi:transposase